MVFFNSRISSGLFLVQIYPEILSPFITLILSHGLCKQSYCQHLILDAGPSIQHAVWVHT